MINNDFYMFNNVQNPMKQLHFVSNFEALNYFPGIRSHRIHKMGKYLRQKKLKLVKLFPK